MSYSLFIPTALTTPGRKKGVKLLDGLPLATLEGEGSFRTGLVQAAQKASLQLNIQIECSSFPLVAKAVAQGKVAALLPTIAACDLTPSLATQVPLPFLRTFDREMCLALNSRLLRIRPILNQTATALTQICSF